MGLWIRSILETKRDGGALSSAQIIRFIDGVVSGAVSRPQAAAFLSAVFINGMTADETVSLTLAMRDSGDVMSWPGLEGPFADKHSTVDLKVFATCGVHPHDAKSCDEGTMAKLADLARHPKCVAVGECGLDFDRNFRYVPLSQAPIAFSSCCLS